jgi:hypothetical protein
MDSRIRIFHLVLYKSCACVCVFEALCVIMFCKYTESDLQILRSLQIYLFLYLTFPCETLKVFNFLQAKVGIKRFPEA